MKFLLFLVPVAAISASAAMAAPTGAAMGGDQGFAVPTLQNDSQVRKANALHALRDEGLKLQTADGGTLTPEHRKYLQIRLDAIRAGDY